MKAITTYACEICGTVYEDRKKAEACEAQGRPEPSVSVGDIVFAKGGFGWFDGDEAWVSNLKKLGRGSPGALPGRRREPHGNCFGDCCNYRFYYVVTAIDPDQDSYSRKEHRLRYHLFTKAMTGQMGHRSGYTYDIHHVKPQLASHPPAAVVEGSKDLLGQKAGDLL